MAEGLFSECLDARSWHWEKRRTGIGNAIMQQS
jgi:hypothetical protein